MEYDRVLPPLPPTQSPGGAKPNKDTSIISIGKG